jgi:hypothetical protein
MRQMLVPFLLVVLLLIAAWVLGTPDETGSSVFFGSETKLLFKTCLFEAERIGGLTEEKREPDILILARIHGPSQADALGQREELEAYFGLPDLTLKQDYPEAGLTWLTYKEIYDEKGKLVSKSEARSRAKIRQTELMNREEYTISLAPKEINAKESVFVFALEIYRTAGCGDSEGLAVMDLIVAKDILWNFGGPLVVGFFFQDKVYFLALTISLDVSSSGPRLGSRLARIL